MSILNPRRPGQLNIYAVELLDRLRGHPECAAIVLGGGVALSHYLDIYEVVQRGFFTIAEAWALWEQKSGGDLTLAKRQVLSHLEGIALRVPLDAIADGAERLRAEDLRTWFRRDFCNSRPP